MGKRNAREGQTSVGSGRRVALLLPVSEVADTINDITVGYCSHTNNSSKQLGVTEVRKEPVLMVFCLGWRLVLEGFHFTTGLGFSGKTCGRSEQHALLTLASIGRLLLGACFGVGGGLGLQHS